MPPSLARSQERREWPWVLSGGTGLGPAKVVGGGGRGVLRGRESGRRRLHNSGIDIFIWAHRNKNKMSLRVGRICAKLAETNRIRAKCRSIRRGGFSKLVPSGCERFRGRLFAAPGKALGAWGRIAWGAWGRLGAARVLQERSRRDVLRLSLTQPQTPTLTPHIRRAVCTRG